jgi:hypothetical protein
MGFLLVVAVLTILVIALAVSATFATLLLTASVQAIAPRALATMLAAPACARSLVFALVFLFCFFSFLLYLWLLGSLLLYISVFLGTHYDLID